MDLPSPNMKCYEIVLATVPLAALLHVVSELRGPGENDLQIRECLSKSLEEKNQFEAFRSSARQSFIHFCMFLYFVCVGMI